MSDNSEPIQGRCADCGSPLPLDGGYEDAWVRSSERYCDDCVYNPRIGLVGCGRSKLDLEEGETIPAQDLYDSNYFQLKRDYAEATCETWKILSAKHGLLDPEEEIEVYDASLNPRSDAYIGDYEAGRWSVQVSNQLSVWMSFQAFYTQYIVLAGEVYVKHLADLLDRKKYIHYPFRRDDLKGIGDQQRWLKEAVEDARASSGAGRSTDDVGQNSIADF